MWPTLLVCASIAVVFLGIWVMAWIDAVEDAQRDRATTAREIDRLDVQTAIERIIRESQAA